MQAIRRVGTKLSLFLIWAAGAARYWLTFSTRNIHGVRVVVVDDRRVLLVAHWYAPWAWTLPGGGIGKNESAEDAAKREVKEETGLTVRSLGGEVGTYTGTWGRHDQVVVFWTSDFEGSLAMTPTLEIMARSWFDIDSLPEEISPSNRQRILTYRDGGRGERAGW
jgi:ADP-ribose pyrophosphatase YjhB (NUDIX family)